METNKKAQKEVIGTGSSFKNPSEELINHLISSKGKTPYLSQQMDRIEQINAATNFQPRRVRDIPLPTLSWTYCTDLSQLEKEKTMSGRKVDVFRNPNLKIRTRAILFNWLMEVCDVLNLRRATYYLAIDYIDRHLSTTEDTNERTLKLVVVTCLFIAIKVIDIDKYCKPEEMASITSGAFTTNDILDQEVEILTKLRGDVDPVTVLGWVCLYLQLVCIESKEYQRNRRKLNSKVDDNIIYPQFDPYCYLRACILLDLCSFDDGMLQFTYSCIAASIVYIVFSNTVLHVSGYNMCDIKTCLEWMSPFATVMIRKLNNKLLRLFCSNSNIVINAGYSLQNHVVDLEMLEEVYDEINMMRYNFRKGKQWRITGWTTSDREYFDQRCVHAYVAKHKNKHMKNIKKHENNNKK